MPIVIVEKEGKRWLVAPCGAVDWVENARASGNVNLSRGNLDQEFAIQEPPPQEAVPVLKEYLQQFPITKPYFDARPNSPFNGFVLEAKSNRLKLLLSRMWSVDNLLFPLFNFSKME